MTLCSLVEICRLLKELPPSVSTVEEFHSNSIAPRSVIVSPSAATITFLDGICKILYPADEGDTFLHNIHNVLSDGTLKDREGITKC